MRRNSWQDGVLGTNCPIPPKWNFTYDFQLKDQIGSYFYSPSLNFQRASGGFGSIIINNRDLVPIPFTKPDGEIIFIIGDWYTQNHTVSVFWGVDGVYYSLLVMSVYVFIYVKLCFLSGFKEDT